MSNQKGSSLIYVLVLLLVIVGGLGYYLLNNQSKLNSILPNNNSQSTDIPKTPVVSPSVSLKYSFIFSGDKIYNYDNVSKVRSITDNIPNIYEIKQDNDPCCIIISTTSGSVIDNGSGIISKIYRLNIQSETLDDITIPQEVGATSVSFSHDGKSIAITKNNNIEIYNIKEKTLTTIAKSSLGSNEMSIVSFGWPTSWSNNDQYLLTLQGGYEGATPVVVDRKGKILDPKVPNVAGGLDGQEVLGWVNNKLYFLSSDPVLEIQAFDPGSSSATTVEKLATPTSTSSADAFSTASIISYPSLHKIIFFYTLNSMVTTSLPYAYSLDTNNGDITFLDQPVGLNDSDIITPDGKSIVRISPVWDTNDPKNSYTNIYTKGLLDKSPVQLLDKIPYGIGNKVNTSSPNIILYSSN